MRGRQNAIEGREVINEKQSKWKISCEMETKMGHLSLVLYERKKGSLSETDSTDSTKRQKK